MMSRDINVILFHIIYNILYDIIYYMSVLCVCQVSVRVRWVWCKRSVDKVQSGVDTEGRQTVHRQEMRRDDLRHSHHFIHL